MSLAFVDTSGWIALLSRNDQLHQRALSVYEELSHLHTRLLTNNYVIDETASRLRYDVGLDSALAFHRMVMESVASRRLRVSWVDERAESQAWGLLEQYRDVKLSLTDATCAVTARSARVLEIFGCDSDFEALGFVVRPGPR